jgi:hypothetical protein
MRGGQIRPAEAGSGRFCPFVAAGASGDRMMGRVNADPGMRSDL